jgi:hypothetical protein
MTWLPRTATLVVVLLGVFALLVVASLTVIALG